MIGVAGKCQPRNFRYSLLNTLHPRDVSRLVLRHGSAPAVHARENRPRLQFKNVLELAVYRLQYLVVREAEDRFIACASQETAQDSFALGGAVRKLIVNEGAGQHACALAA